MNINASIKKQYLEQIIKGTKTTEYREMTEYWTQKLVDVESYKGKDAILKARATACIGDAYVGLENYEKALSCFEKAAATIDNMFAAGYLLKAGAVAEKLGQNAKALGFYETIKDQYPQSIEAYDIDKYIGRIENK